MRIFKEAYKLIEKEKVQEDFQNNAGVFYKIKDYVFKIYLKTTVWFSQCGCRVGVSNKPAGLCKHSVAGIVNQFIKENNLKLTKDEK